MRIRIVLDMPKGPSLPHIDIELTPRKLAYLCNHRAGKKDAPWGKPYLAVLQITSDSGEIHIQGPALLAAINEARQRGMLWRDIADAIHARYDSGSEVS
jgi:hypothetical protein